MSEFNTRIDPTRQVPSIHLHEHSGAGLDARAKKDAGSIVSPPISGGGNYYNYPSLFPPSLEFPPLPALPPSLLPTEFIRYNSETFQIEVFNGSGWTAITSLALGEWLTALFGEEVPVLTIDADTATITTATLLALIATTAATITTPSLTITDPTELTLIIENLPTADPGGGRVWLSAT